MFFFGCFAFLRFKLFLISLLLTDGRETTTGSRHNNNKNCIILCLFFFRRSYFLNCFYYTDIKSDGLVKFKYLSLLYAKSLICIFFVFWKKEDKQNFFLLYIENWWKLIKIMNDFKRYVRDKLKIYFIDAYRICIIFFFNHVK